MQDFKKYLNPLYKDLDNVVDFSDVSIETEGEKEEYPYLKNITNIYVTGIRTLLPRLDKLTQELEDQIEVIKQETGDDAKDARSVYNKILNEIQNTVDRVNLDLLKMDSPYFGKIVFEPYHSRLNKAMSIYIGKFALVDMDTHIPLITDWRAPIANIYYRNSGPTDNVEFEAPSGVRKGDLKQKRQFEISRARIRAMYDAKTGNAAADAFLLSQLNSRLGKKLADIVSTIQAQQNEIIREEINIPTLIQGVAGSGKTTILLHRLAYLFYNYQEQIHPENSLIIAPNRMFLDYISDVLPSLGVKGVITLTYLFWSKDILGWDSKYTLSTKEEDLVIKEYKGSREFLKFIDQYVKNYEKYLLDNLPFSRKDIIEDRYYELKKSYPDISMVERFDLALEYAIAQKQFKQLRTGSFDDSSHLEQVKKKEVRNYLNRNLNPYLVYKRIFKENLLDKSVCKYTLEGVASKDSFKFFRMEDLAPILYIHFKFMGTKDYTRDYIVVDECQDLSFLEISTLLMIAKGGNITLAGDLAQSIIPPFYIKDWNDLLNLIKSFGFKKTSYHQLNRCYRTTIEIIEFANKIFRDRFPKSFTLPEAVLRHGDEVERMHINTNISDLDANSMENLISYINGEFDKGYASCAILCRDRNHATAVYEKLKEYSEKIIRDIIDFNSSDYTTGLLVLPVSQAKGLEFDSVIIADLNKEHYPDDEYSTRLLYVAVTRALHRLTVITNRDSDISPLIA